MIRVESAADRVNVAKIYEAEQEHIFRYWEDLSGDARRQLLEQISRFEPLEVARLVRTLLISPPSTFQRLGSVGPAPMIPIPFDAESEAAHNEATAAGWQALRDGEVGVFLVAGGQGTRLQFDGPKGMFPVGPVTERSLFQLYAERILALGRRLKRPLHWFIMTSEENHSTTCEFFKANGFFGISPGEIVIQKQGMLPVVDTRGKILMDSKHHIVMSPDGHGSTVRVIRSLADTLSQRGIKHLFYWQVDNPLIEICDPAFVGHHVLKGSDFSSKAIAKLDPEEKVGVFCESAGNVTVVEYSELGDEESHRRDSDGKLSFRAGNLANHIISVDFLCSEERDLNMPYHVAYKSTPHLRDGKLVDGKDASSCKFESFIFDVLTLAENPVVLEAPRSEFSPLKNMDGDDSPTTCRQALIEKYAKWLEDAGLEVPHDAEGKVLPRIEISPLYASSAQELKEKLNGNDVKIMDPMVLE